MKKTAFQEYEHLIIRLIKEIEDKIVSLEESSIPIAPSSALGRLTRMDAISDQGIQQAMLSSSKMRLEALRNAHARIQAGTYGTCIRCRKEISDGRLTAVPEALICVPCMEKKRR